MEISDNLLWVIVVVCLTIYGIVHTIVRHKFGEPDPFWNRAFTMTSEEIRDADLVIHDGRIVKNRFGYIGATNVSIPDGSYHVIRIEDED